MSFFLWQEHKLTCVTPPHIHQPWREPLSFFLFLLLFLPPPRLLLVPREPGCHIHLGRQLKYKGKYLGLQRNIIILKYAIHVFKKSKCDMAIYVLLSICADEVSTMYVLFN